MRQTLFFTVALLAMAVAHAQVPADPVPAADLREEVQHINVNTQDLNGKPASGRIPLTIYRPPGDGPFPLVIMNHGRASGAKRAEPLRQRYESVARYLVNKGFVVLVPTRLGYGETFGLADPETAGGCSTIRPEAVAMAASDQVLQTLEYARLLPYVDARRWVVMGQSVGGLATIATVARNPPGLVGGINFSGGTGGSPTLRPGDPCNPAATASLWRSKAVSARAPMLWFYWANDKYWGTDNPKQWHKAWIEGGGKADFQAMPAAGADGHNGLAIDMNDWVPLAEKFFASLGFDKPGTVAVPVASGFARVDELAKVPVGQTNGTYTQFLASPKPRAYAISPTGSSGWATGDWAAGRALGFCQARRGVVCKLYAVDDDVVWVP